MIRTLVVADENHAYQELREYLAAIPDTGFAIERAVGRAAFRRLGDMAHDVCLVWDRAGSGAAFVRYARAAGASAPLIVISDRDDRDWQTRTIRAGAADCLVRSELTPASVDRAVRYALERHRSAERLLRLAAYDHLTGISNRALAHEHLNGALVRARRTRQTAAVLLVDIDRFRRVNDSLGHSIGDAVLVETAAILRRSLGPRAVLGRLGSDEFVALLEGDDVTDDAVTAARDIVEQVRQIAPEGRNVQATCSVGLAMFPLDGTTVDDLLRHADAALAAAKREGDTYRCFQSELMQEATRRMEMEQRLRAAVDAEALELYYQPQIDLDNGEVIGLEALLRWRDADEGMISPGRFIPLLEETGLIIPVGEWVIRSACEQQVAWERAGAGRRRVAVNVSPLQFQRDLFGAVSRSLEATGADPEYLELEITESMLIDDLDGAREVLSQLKSIGVRIAIDDFGTGYSSLVYLRRLPIDILKIDRSFLRDVEEDDDAVAVVSAIIALAHQLGLEVIAEGVETEGQRRFLEAQGCEIGQGFLFSKPLPPEEHFVRPVATVPAPAQSEDAELVMTP